MEPATLRLYSWSSVLQAKAPKKSAGKTQIWEREKNVLKQQKRATFIILYDDQVVASGSPQLLFVVVSLALTFKFCLSPPSLCYRLTPIGAALSCKKDAKRPKLAQNSLRWPILADSIGGQSCKSAECLSDVRPHNSYPDHLNALGGSEGPNAGSTLIFCCILTLFLAALHLYAIVKMK